MAVISENTNLQSNKNIFSGNYHYPYYQSFEMNRPGVRREGWGSAEATEMVTNNMFYITCRQAYIFGQRCRDSQYDPSIILLI